MKLLLFLSRVAFICNLFFVLAASLQFLNWIQNEEIKSSIVVMGYIMAAALNPVINLGYIVLFFFRRNLLQAIPLWLMAANGLFLVTQIIYIFFLNDTKHN